MNVSISTEPRRGRSTLPASRPSSASSASGPPRRLPFTPTIQIGWRLDQPYWGKSYAVEAARACLQDAFDRAELTEIVAYTSVINQPSRRVMEKLGMTYDPAKGFLHPVIAEGNPLREHVLYRLTRQAFLANGSH